MRAKPLLAVALILAGCGGAGSSNWQQVRGGGFTYNAPAAWKVTGATASDGAISLIDVRIFQLVRAYEPARRAAASRELDRVAGRIAAQLKGSISSRRALEVGGLDARSYVIAYHGRAEEITFVLHGRREYQLLCRRSAGAADDACAELLRSFALGSS